MPRPDALASAEALFSDSESIVIAAFQAQKLSHSAESTGTQLLKALGAKVLPRDVLRPAVIAFTVKRSLSDRGFVPFLHFTRPLELAGGGGTPKSSADGSGGGKLELRKSYPLKALHDVRITSASRAAAAAAAASGGSGSRAGSPGKRSALAAAAAAGELQQQQVLELCCASHHNTPEHRAQYVLPDMSSVMFLVSLAIQLLRQQNAVLPSVVGVPVERLDAWWSGHSEEVTEGLSSFGLEVVTPGAIVVGRGDESDAVLVSDKEAAELGELLQYFELGLGESDQFAAALQEEASALEAANVYALLEAAPQVEGVMAELRHTQSILDDLDESLKVFDFKLRHMRNDIAAIEASNNSLECAARHNAALLELLTGLLSSLELDPGLVEALERPALDPFKLKGVVRAAWQLHAARLHLAAESPDALSPLLAQMRVVREARGQLDDLTERFVSKVVAFLAGLVSQLTGEAMADAGGGSGARSERARRVAPPPRQRLRDTLRHYRPLIEVLAALEPRALQHLQQQMCHDFNALLRRELHLACGELRRGSTAELAASGAAGEGDYTLVKERPHASGSKQRLPRISMGSGAGSVAGSDSQSEFAVDPAEFAAGAASLGASAAKRAAFLEGSSPGVPLHEAWSLLLDGFLPFLADEAELLADLLLMYSGDEERLRENPPSRPASPSPQAQQPQPGGPPSPQAKRSGSLRDQHAQQASPSRREQQQQLQPAAGPPRPPDCPLTYDGIRGMEVLLSGLEEEFTALSDLASRSHQVLMLPLLAVARAWQAQLTGRPPAQPLANLVAALCDRLQGQWTSFVATQVAAVEAYEGRGKMGLQQGIKHLHVLPFVSQFCLMAHDMEVAVAEGLAAAAAAAGVQGASAAALAAAAAQPQRGVDAAGGGGRQAAALAASQTIREDADGMYGQLCPTLLSRLERLASSDAKYAERCRLENYVFMAEALRGLAARLPVLHAHWQVAEARREASLGSYVTDQLMYSKLWRLLEFGDKLDAMLQHVSPPEVSFQKDCSPAEVRSLMRSTMDGVDKKLEAMATRVRKHLGGGPLFNSVWATLKERLLARYEHLEWLLEQCYPTTPLRPSPEELRELFRATSAG